MALAHSSPPGLGARHSARAAECLTRPRQTTIEQVLGWLGMAGLTAVWLQGLAGAILPHPSIDAFTSIPN